MTAASRRRYWAALAAITLVGLLRGLLWVASLPVPDSDEGQHFSYVQSLATGQGIPVTGRDHVTQDTITLFKYDHVGPPRSDNVSPSVTDPGWGLVREQYEGFQGPLYYLLMVPFYWAGRFVNVLAAFYSIRIATVLLCLTAVPLVSFLAKELFADRPAVWLLSPACLVSLQLFNAQFSLISNDGIMVSLGALCLLAFARSWRGLTARRGAALGATIALCGLSKGSAAALAPALVLGSVAMVAYARPAWREFVRWGAAAAVVASVMMLPWLAFNQHAYHALSGIKANATLTTPVIGTVPFNRAGVHALLRTTRDTLFTAQSLTAVPAANRYRTLWTVVPGAVGVLAVAAAALRRQWDALAKMIWLASSIGLGYGLLVLLVFVQAGGGSNIVGRHLGVLLPMFCTLVAYAAVILLGSGIGSTFVLLFLLASFVVEVPATNWLTRAVYAQPNVSGKLVPVVDQDFNDSAATATAVRLSAPCPAELVGFIFSGPPPPSITVAGQRVSQPAPDGHWSLYRILPTPVGLLTVNFPAPVGLRADSTLTGRPEAFAAPGARGSPDVRLYCPVRDPLGYRFGQLYPPEHPFGLSLGMIEAWPVLDEVLAAALVLLALSATAADYRRLGWHDRRLGAHYRRLGSQRKS